MFRIHDILVPIWIRGSTPLMNLDPDLDSDPDSDPDLAIFVIDLQDDNKK